MEEYRIRDYVPKDYGPIQELWEPIGMGSPVRGDTADLIERTLRHEGARLFILEEIQTGEIVGTSWITCDGRRLLLHHFGIRLSHQGRGLSRWLTRATLEHAKALNMQIKCEVNRSNIRAIEIYRRAGFKPLGDYDVFILRDPSKVP